MGDRLAVYRADGAFIEYVDLPASPEDMVTFAKALGERIARALDEMCISTLFSTGTETVPTNPMRAQYYVHAIFREAHIRLMAAELARYRHVPDGYGIFWKLAP